MVLEQGRPGDRGRIPSRSVDEAIAETGIDAGVGVGAQGDVGIARARPALQRRVAGERLEPVAQERRIRLVDLAEPADRRRGVLVPLRLAAVAADLDLGSAFERAQLHGGYSARPIRERANCAGSKGLRSSIPSPTPIAWTGSPNFSASATSTPPRAEPSSLVTTSPG